MNGQALSKMPNKVYRPCNKCKRSLTRERFCEECKTKIQREEDKRRGSAHERGYTHVFAKKSKAFLAKEENQFCILKFPGCSFFAECTDHIRPVLPSDPLFMDESNFQPACIHCNSVKGRREIIGKRD